MIVVSEIGEQWSPQTAPAMQADTQMMESGLPFSSGNAFRQIGIRIPKVPQEVPVANARPTAITNTIAGRKFCRDCALPDTRSATYVSAPRDSVTDFSVHARTRIMIAGTIALKPSVRLSMHSLNLRTLLSL